MTTDTSNALTAQADSPEIRAVLDDHILDEMFSSLDLAGSYIVSALEALRRGDRKELKLRRRQIGDCVRHAWKTHDLLSGEGGK